MTSNVESGIEPKVRRTEKIEETIFKCSQCKFTSKWKYSVKVHEAGVHSGERPFSCSLCPYKTNVPSRLESHMKTHDEDIEKPLKCPFLNCPYAADYKSQLTTHTRTHTGERPHECPLCPKTFSHKSTLHSHIRTHTGEHPCKCPKLDYGHSNEQDHEVIHTKEKKFLCLQCDNKTGLKSSLVSHMKTHENAKTFSCPPCPFRANHTAGIKIDLSQVHSKVKEFKCDLCPYAGKTKNYLKQHLKSHSEEKPHSCDQCKTTLPFEVPPENPYGTEAISLSTL